MLTLSNVRLDAGSKLIALVLLIDEQTMSVLVIIRCASVETFKQLRPLATKQLTTMLVTVVCSTMSHGSPNTAVQLATLVPDKSQGGTSKKLNKYPNQIEKFTHFRVKQNLPFKTR